jgi:hypothetical protein
MGETGIMALSSWVAKGRLKPPALAEAPIVALAPAAPVGDLRLFLTSYVAALGFCLTLLA